MEQKVFRINQIEQLKNMVRSYEPNKIFLVRANKSYASSGAELFVNELVEQNQLCSFFEFETNPQLNDLKRGIEIFKSGNFELIIAIGGGSVIDMAKLIGVFAHQTQPYEDFISGDKELKELGTPVLAIPTTAGTGAEATQFAVLYIDKQKYSVAAEIMLPKFVFLSSQFSVSANPYLSACTGLDAFCQAVESIWSVNANYESEKYALHAIDKIWHNLYFAVQQNESWAREQVQQAAYLAGKAINITKTTAPHALSYAFTSYYNIPHGHAVALSLPYFLTYNHGVSNLDCTDPRGAESVKERIDNMLHEMDLTIETAPKKIEAFFNSLGININIPTLIKDFDPQIIIENVNIERLKNNPRKVSRLAISNLLSIEL